MLRVCDSRGRGCDESSLVQLTPAIKDYCTKKLSAALSKVGRKVTKCDVHLVVDKNPSIEKPATAEVVLSVKGTVIRTSKNTHDMYASIDAVGDSVKRKLRNYKEVSLIGPLLCLAGSFEASRCPRPSQVCASVDSVPAEDHRRPSPGKARGGRLRHGRDQGEYLRV